MKLIRSWPAEIPEGRAYVVDGIDRFVMGADTPNFDYRGLAGFDDDLVLIEWDIAVGGEQLIRFMDRAAAEPDRVRVAPYYLYRRHGEGRSGRFPFYCHRVREAGTRTWVRGPQDPYCHMFGFGLVYLPIDLVRRFVAQMPEGTQFTDTTFSRWHMRNAKHRNVPIDWDCHAVHLHYELPDVPEVGNGDMA
ncbi:MAG TPA: hypothetical protein VGK49_02975 [Ilumatobacteraceae bacterium]